MTILLKKMAPFIIYQYIGHQKEEGVPEYLPFPRWNDEGPYLMQVSIAAVCSWLERSSWKQMAVFHGTLLHPCSVLFSIPWCFPSLEGWSIYVLFSPNDHFLSALWPSLCTITLCENELLWLTLTTAVVASSLLASCIVTKGAVQADGGEVRPVAISHCGPVKYDANLPGNMCMMVK